MSVCVCELKGKLKAKGVEEYEEIRVILSLVNLWFI